MDGRSGDAVLQSDWKTPKRSGRLAIPPSLIPVGTSRITPEMLSLVELEPEQIELVSRSVPGGAANIQDIYPLAPLQEGLLFHHMMDGKGDTYVVLSLIEFESRDHLNAFIGALQHVIDRHDVLRTAFFWEKLPQPVQVVYREAAVPVEELRLDDACNPVEQLKQRMRPDLQSLSLTRAPLIRVDVARGGTGRHWYALLKIHHLVCDGLSLEVVSSEVRSRIENHAQELPVPMQYRIHVAQTLAHASAYNAEAFFQKKLGRIDEPTAPFGLFDVHGDGNRVDTARRKLEPELALLLRAQARRHRVTPAALFHAAWSVVLARTSNLQDVVFGTVLFGRLRMTGSTHHRAGLFLNTLPLCLRLRDANVRDLTLQTQHELLELLNYEQTSLALAQRCSGVAGSAPLFTTLMNYRHGERNSDLWTNTAQGYRELATRVWTNYPITLSIDDLGEGFVVTVQTDRRVAPARIDSYLHVALRSLVQALEQAPQTPALELAVLPDSERRQVIEEFNATQVPYPQEKLVHGLFEEQVERTPDAVAVVYEGHSLTYAELNTRANQLARHLRERGIGPDLLVGICIERSLEMVLGLLGILKAGGAYVPLDPAYPSDRLQHMLSDAAPKVLLTQARLRESLPSSGAEVIALDAQWDEVARHPAGNLDPRTLGLGSHHLAYIIYTSGSTGMPKGAMNEHRGVVNRLQWMQDQYQLSSEDRVLQKTPFSFDVSVWEFFWTPMTGARLIVARPEGHKDPHYLKQLIEETGVTTLHFVPSMLQTFLDQHQPGTCSSVRHVVCSGEELPAPLQTKCFDSLPQARLSNLYGPTEAAIDVTAWECSPEDCGTRVPIGRPISNIQTYLLDGHMQPVPVGVAGEIYIGGLGVARGYLNRPQLTAERFIKDPFSSDPQGRLYRSGDLGRWRANGNIEYLGRNDNQVKIRGFRIELGEIEAQLLQHPQVKEAAVLAREYSPGDKRLIAYFVPSQNIVPESDDITADKFPISQLREHLSARLPDHMIPSVWVTLRQFPLTSNGKVNRHALPEPQGWSEQTTEYIAPRSELERVLAEIWAQVLRVDRVGLHDDFFELGGHSLLGITLISKVAGRLAFQPPVVTIFRYPTIAEMARLFEELLLRDTQSSSNTERSESAQDWQKEGAI